jgi:hypothetical protein
MITLSMTASVGVNAANKVVDVNLLKALLNAYARKYNLPILSNNKVDEDFIDLIEHFQTNIVKIERSDGIVFANKVTFKSLLNSLHSGYKKVSITKPENGVLTWEAEGTEGGRFHSRSFHVPSNNSGLTIGRGYDMKEKTATQIKNHLILAGVEVMKADVISLAAGKIGNMAKKFVIENDLLDFEISAQAQLKLFEIIYKELELDVKRICNKSKIVTDYGVTNWIALNSKIKAVTIDLRFRGDYHGSSRRFLQKHITSNDLVEFTKEILKEANWGAVPSSRRQARIKFIQS